MIYESWIFVSLIALLILTYEDFTNKRRLGLKSWSVDDRKNYYMIGATTMLFFISPFVWWIKLLLLFGTALFVGYISKRNVFGSADIRAFSWLIPGWFLVGVGGFFLLSFVIVTGGYVFLKNREGLSGNYPFFLFILVMHLFTFFFYLVL